MDGYEIPYEKLNLAQTMTPEEILNKGDYDICRAWIEYHRGGGWFTGRLIDLAMGADVENTKKLMEGFPYEIGMVIWYRSGLNPQIASRVKEEDRSSAT
jgi:hypothetical protein